MFHICALKEIYTYVVNQQIHTDKICFIKYSYSTTCCKAPWLWSQSDRNMQVDI